MDPLLISVAFAAGLAIYQLGLPPMVGFLVAGFVLNATGFESSDTLETIGNLGVTLLLFTVGLKLKLKDLLHSEVWAGASLHMALIFLVNLAALYLLLQLDLPLTHGADLQMLALLAFALCFSSTVFAVKILEKNGQLTSLYGRTAIGILIMQDVFAVIFLAVSSGQLPTVWALGLLGLPLLRPLLYRLLDSAGHEELLVLYGIFLALSLGAGLFELVHVKPDLGALIIGMLLANHPKAGEMARSLLNFKELLLVVFFLNIGLAAFPSWDTLLVGALLALILPFKVMLYHLVLTLFRFRARSALLTSLTLANYSEFGLIVGAVGVSTGIISTDWLVAMALALSLSFVLAAWLHDRAPLIYLPLRTWLMSWQRHPLHIEDRPIDPGHAHIIVLGMGRVGSGAYDYMTGHHPEKQVLGIDLDHDAVDCHRELGRNVIQGDATDSDFWEKVRMSADVELVMLSMPMHEGNLYAAKRLKATGYTRRIAAVVGHDDHARELRDMGVDVVFNIYLEAGTGFAEHVCESALLKA